jgi:hypothetical protein
LLAATTKACVYANLGYATEAAVAFTQVMTTDHWEVVRERLRSGMSCAGFKDMIHGGKSLTAAQLEFDMPALQLAEKASVALERLGVDEGELRSMMDVAGELLRRERMMWLGGAPDVTVLINDHAVAVNYRLDASPQLAASLTWELAEALITRDLMRYGVTVGFIGEAKNT